MSIKNVNNFFGYSLYTLGALKFIYVILAFLNIGVNVASIFTGGTTSSVSFLESFSVLIGFAQIVLAFASIVMIIINLKKEPKVVSGYLYGIGAVLIELIVPSFFMIYFIVAECWIYMKAGSKIINGGAGGSGNSKRNKELVKNTEWFFDEKREENRITEQKGVETKDDGNDKLDKVLDSLEKLDSKLDNKGISISTLLIVWIIIIGIILGVVFIKGMMTKSSIEDNSNLANYNNTQNIISSNTSDRIEKKENTLEEPENDSRLVKIVNAYNNSKAAATMTKQGYIMTAISSENKIIVFASGAGVNVDIEFVLNGDILSTEIEYNEVDSRITMIEILNAMFLIDAVGQFKGYPERTIIEACQREESKYYTLEKEGIEIRDSNNKRIIEIDLSSEFPFLNAD